MGISTRIEHNAIIAIEETCLLHLVDQFSLDIALEVGYFDIRKCSPQLRQKAVERLVAIDSWFVNYM